MQPPDARLCFSFTRPAALHPLPPQPDIYTYLGIYSRNEWGLKPSIFEARLP